MLALHLSGTMPLASHLGLLTSNFYMPCSSNGYGPPTSLRLSASV
jgi:hypothetical protein